MFWKVVLCCVELDSSPISAASECDVEFVDILSIKSSYHINCGVIQEFPALRKAVTTHVKKCRMFSRVLIYPISCLHVTRLWRHSVRLMKEQQSLHDSQLQVAGIMATKTLKSPYR